MKDLDDRIMNKYADIRLINEAMITVLELNISNDDKSDFIGSAAYIIDNIREEIARLWEERHANE